MNEYTELSLPINSDEKNHSAINEISIPLPNTSSRHIATLDTKNRGRLIYIITFLLFSSPIIILSLQIYSKYAQIQNTNGQLSSITSSLTSLKEKDDFQKKSQSSFSKENLELVELLENKKIENVTNTYEISHLRSDISTLDKDISSLLTEIELLTNKYNSLLKKSKVG